MAVNLSPVGGVAAQFFDNSGNVLTGGKIYTYLAGTTTPSPAYTTSAGNVAWSNPIILNASGRVSGSGEIWLTDGILYKFVLTDSNDVLIATYDNINGINSNFVAFTNQQEIQTATAGQTVFNLTTTTYQPGTNSLSVFVDGVNQYGPGAQYAYLETDQDTVTFLNGLHVGALVKFTTSQLNSGAGQNAAQTSFTGFKSQVGNVQDLADADGSDWIGFEQAGSGAVAISAQDKMRQMVSVLDFGADPTGVSDSTAAMIAAEAYSTSVYFPAGTYKVTIAPTLGVSWGIGVVEISSVQTYLSPLPGPVSVIYASVFNPDTTNTNDASVKLQLAINFAQENNLYVQFQENAQYKLTTGLTFKQGKSSTDTKSYAAQLYGNNSTLFPAASVVAISVVPRCLLADAGTGRGVAPINIYDLNFDGTAAPSTAKALIIGLTGYACDNFGYSIVQNLVCTNFDNNSTISLVECRHLQFNYVVIRGSTFRIEATAANSFCGDLNFQTCEFISSATNDNLDVNSGNNTTNAQVRGLHFESCIFYGSTSEFTSNGVNSQTGDIWFVGCQWDVGTTAVIFDATNSGKIFQIHFINPYIVNYSTRAIYLTSAGSGTIYQFSVNNGGFGSIGGANAILALNVENVQINNSKFDSCTSSGDLINIDGCENVSLNNNVATRCSTVPYMVSIGNASNYYSILGNMADVATSVVNDYTGGSPTKQVANNLKT